MLTATLLLYPVRLLSEYRPIQAPYIFDNLPLFSVLFVVWTLVLLLLVLSKPDPGDRLSWENMGLACVFGLVFLGFWIVITPYGSYTDSIFNMGHVNWLLKEESIPIGHENLVYFDFPGLHLLTSSLSKLSGLDIPQTRLAFMLFNNTLFSALLYVLLTKLLARNRLALAGVSLAMLGSVLLVEKMHVFAPAALGFALLAGFLIAAFAPAVGHDEQSNATSSPPNTSRAPRTLLFLTLFAGMTITYFPSSLLVALVVIGVFATERLNREGKRETMFSTGLLLLVMVLAWGVYWTWHTFDTLAGFLPQLWSAVLSGEFLTTALTLRTANIGAHMPLWASVIRGFWWGFLATATLLGLYHFIRTRKLDRAEVVLTGGLLAVIGLTIVGMFGTRGGSQFARFLMYTPLFCIPLLLLLLHRTANLKRWITVALPVLFVVLALPTFLASVNLIGTEAIREADCTAGDFVLANTLERGKSYVVYGVAGPAVAWVNYYAPDSTIRYVSEDTLYGDEETAWQEMEALIQTFQYKWVLPSTQKLFVDSPRGQEQYQHLLGIPPDDPRWSVLDTMARDSTQVYSNGTVCMYVAG
jgi:hypothetical protein